MSDPEVSEQSVSVCKENVFGLHIAVDKAVSMSIVERGAYVASDPLHFGERQLLL